MFKRVVLVLSLMLMFFLVGGFKTEALAQKKFTSKEEIIRALSPEAREAMDKMGAKEDPKREDDYRLPLSIQFHVNSSNFHPDSLLQLQALGGALSSEELRSYRFCIEGHTCNLGSATYNKYLSKKRAEAVSSYLIKNYGLSSDQLETVGYGKEKPRYSNESNWGKAKNRRVEIVQLGPFKDSPKVSLNVDFKYKRYEETRELKNGITLFSGDLYSVSFIPHQDCYVYVCQYQSDSPKNWQGLFPQENYTRHTNPVKANKFYRIPDIEKGWLELDKNTGEEKIAVIASKTPLSREGIELVLMPPKPSKSSLAREEREVEIEVMGPGRIGGPPSRRDPDKRPDPGVRGNLPLDLFVRYLSFSHR